MTTCIRRASSTWTVCHCLACTKSTARLRKLHAAGALPPSPSVAAWAEVDRLTAAGWTPGAIAAAAGMSNRTVIGAFEKRALHGTHTWSRIAARKILTHDAIPPSGRIPAEPYVRRLRALIAIGWTLEALSEPTGQSMTTLSAIARGATTWMLGSTARTIADAYDALSNTPGPSPIARRRAARLGWAPPLAWDDIDTDPAPIVTIHDDTPDPIAVQRAIDGLPVKVTAAERAEAVRIMAARGWSDAEMAERLHICGRTVQRIRDLHGIASTWKADAA